MNHYSLMHLADHVLLRDLHELVTRDRKTTASLLAHLGEVDARKLHVPKGHSSMFAYCVHELRMSEDVAYKRIRAARAARVHAPILDAIASGRLHVAAVVLLAPYLDAADAAGLLAAAEHKTKAQVEHLIAERFPQGDVPTLVRPLTSPDDEANVATVIRSIMGPGPMNVPVHDVDTSSTPVALELAPGPVVPLDDSNLAVPMGPPSESQPAAANRGPSIEAQLGRLRPLSPGRYALQVTVSDRTHTLLQRARELLGHVSPRPEIADVLERALEEFVERLECRKFGRTDRPRAPRNTTSARHIPAKLKRAVHARDGGRCTFQADNGRRCEATSHLEFDHVRPVARGGRTTLDNLRLRCRAHNQYDAERVYGAGFMQEKRGASRIARS